MANHIFFIKATAMEMESTMVISKNKALFEMVCSAVVAVYTQMITMEIRFQISICWWIILPLRFDVLALDLS